MNRHRRFEQWWMSYAHRCRMYKMLPKSSVATIRRHARKAWYAQIEVADNAEVDALTKERDELLEQVHICTVCKEYCKECNCHRTEVRELVEALRECRDELHGYGELYDEATAMDLVAKTDRILAKHESDGA